MDENDMPTALEVKEFQALKTHEEKCARFQSNPKLGRIFRAAHFPKPEIAAEIATIPVKTV
jgi:hypothetical protein